ncbi:TetR/AcrR family transcriptional regulator [Zavarzinia sp. CC-PAN008]|uniref:TetR/AcrR family transcriptional regulator n=1 Tax=Zavarzinia sp. CC-PAN008 TaxID=3243332 RepID=UPI003F748E72
MGISINRKTPARPARKAVADGAPARAVQTRGAIVTAALAQFLDTGYARTTMAAVARRAGVAKGTPYLYFPTKEALFEGVVQDVIVDSLVEIDAATIGESESVEAFLRRTLVPAMHQIERQGRAAVAHLVIAEGVEFPTLAHVYRTRVVEPFQAQMQRLARIAHDRGELKCDALLRYPQLLVGPVWLGVINNMVLDPGHPLDIGFLFEAYLDLIFGGRGTPPAA